MNESFLNNQPKYKVQSYYEVNPNATGKPPSSLMLNNDFMQEDQYSNGKINQRINTVGNLASGRSNTNKNKAGSKCKMIQPSTGENYDDLIAAKKESGVSDNRQPSFIKIKSDQTHE